MGTPWSRVSQPQHCRHLGRDKFLIVGCPVHYRAYSSIPVLYPPDVSSTFPSPTNCKKQKCLPPDVPQWRTTNLVLSMRKSPFHTSQKNTVRGCPLPLTGQHFRLSLLVTLPASPQIASLYQPFIHPLTHWFHDYLLNAYSASGDIGANNTFPH